MYFLEVATQGERSQPSEGLWAGLLCPAHDLCTGRTLSSPHKGLTRHMLGCLQLHFTSSPAPLPTWTLTPVHVSVDTCLG